ncbi:CpaF/VirB11 family protein [Arcobacter sp. CECT 8986]|uniref:CpaF/VirB11 family protein n=1 Tax=Arcobacter sp. CECT 8986 TaxID=2044507 RepID=UPI0013E92377|nr:ATPase, T2SS/T4P/T4SS family [Arcobacter sp. CECT 8986]
MNRLLNNLIQVFDKYFQTQGANEIVILKEKELFLCVNGKWNEFKDEQLKKEILNDFLIFLANDREQQFNKKNRSLSTSIPGTNYRVQALHKTALNDQDFSINIRIPPKEIFPIESFKLATNLPYSYDDILNFISDRKNILISGGTGSGKTSLLNTLMKKIDLEERLVIIQDSPELKSKNRNQTSILVDKKDTGTFTYQDAIDAATRLFPERLILGELDTRNTLMSLRLNNTGHAGTISTVHANSAEDALYAMNLNIRFERDISDKTITEYISRAIDYIIQIERNKKTNEREIVEILDLKQYTKDL